MYEKKSQPLALQLTFLKRLGKNLIFIGVIIGFTLLPGVMGYHFFAEVSWIDAFHNGSMILSGVGPVINIESNSEKIISSLYALFYGLVFVRNIGVLLAPLMHRIMHSIHMEE